MAKLDEEKVKQILYYYKEYGDNKNTIKILMEKYDMSTKAIYRIVRRIYWKNISI